MTKTCKKSLLAALFTLFFAVCVGLFAACGGQTGGNDDAVLYTVTVKTDESTFASGVRVTVGKDGAAFDFKDTDANGKAEFELVPDNYTVTLSNLPAHYTVAAGTDLNFTAEKHDLTVMLAEEEEGFAYKISLVNPDGTPYYAEGVMVGICTLNGNCLTPVALGSDGVAHCPADPGDYHVQILNLPAASTFEKDELGYYTGQSFSATETEMTITVYPAPVTAEVLDATPMTEAEKTAYAQKNSLYTPDTVSAYHFAKTLAPNETAYYSVTLDLSGDYNFYKDGDAAYLFNGTEQRLGNNGRFAIYSALSLENGSTYYFNVTNTGNEEITAEFVMEAPASSSSTVTGADTVDVMISKEGVNAVVELAPEAGASYKLTVKGTQQTSVLQFTSAYYAQTAVHPDDSFQTNGELNIKFTEDMVGKGSVFFSVAVKGVTYPAMFQIEVEKIADLKNTTTVLHTTETLSKFADETEKRLAPVPFDGSATLVYNDTDNFYHLGTVDGPVVVVMLTQKSSRFNLNGGLGYLEENNERIGGNPYIVETTSSTDKADMTKGNTYDDYRLLLRGFGDYKYEPNSSGGFTLVRPEITENSYYAKFVNKDGVYPLTKELESFLKGLAVNCAESIGAGAAEGSEWLFACYYYTDEAEGEKDVVVGEYVQESMAGNVMLTVNADGTFTIAEAMGSTTGTWVKNNDGTYTFTTDSDDPYWVIPYDVTRNAQTGTLTFMDGENEAYVFEVYTDPVIGNYLQESLMGNVTLTVNADGTFVINEGRGDASGTWTKNSDGTYAFTKTINGWTDEYTVTRDAQTGGLKFHDDYEEDPDTFAFEFAVYSDPVTGNYSAGRMGPNLTVNADGTFVITDNGNETTGTWVKNGDGTYTFTENNPTFGEIPYDVTRDEQDGTLTFMDGENEAYVFMAVSEEE